ncbi:MAG: hypothetical protein M1832_000038 [Thelocarpon impressellum]|nr:MAG: hypothetical protein M1832_000038 [Thelocarpon impressellum]
MGADCEEDSESDPLKSLPLPRCADLLLVLNTPKGRGVFAARDIPARTILDVCPVLVLEPDENERHVRHTKLAIVLGLGSMFNHSTLHQNVGWMRDVANLLVTYQALRDIRQGEELCISYGAKLTFEDAEADGCEDSMEGGDGAEVLGKIDLG